MEYNWFCEEFGTFHMWIHSPIDYSIYNFKIGEIGKVGKRRRRNRGCRRCRGRRLRPLKIKNKKP